jgi:DNA-binding MarR family transcriptional regulator
VDVPVAYGEGAVPQQRLTDQFELKPAQQRVLGVLKSEGTSRLTRARYEELSGVSRSQAAYDLAELVEYGLLERVGSGRATRYRIVHQTTPGRNGRRRWTQERIRAALEEFCAGRDVWPSAAEFKRAGRFDLYVAASRYGGIRFWTTELGVTREAQPAPPAAERRRWTFRPRLQWVPAAAVAALALALAGGGHIRLSPGGAVLQAAPPQVLDLPSLKPPTVRQRAQPVTRPARQTVRHMKRASRPTHTAPAQHASTTTTSTELASVQSSTPSSTAATQTTPPARTTSSTPTPASSSNPAPLPAPSGGNAAHPLPPPRR